MKSNAKQISAIYTLLGKLGLRDEKEDIVTAFTGNRTSSIRSMTFNEAKALIAHLKSSDREEAASTKMRNKILSMAHEMNWRKADMSVDMDHVNNWCLSRSYLKKMLDDYKYKELPALVTQFEQVYKSHLNG